MGFSSKHLTVFSPETVNIKKLANLTANTKNYRQITLNTKPHSDPPINPAAGSCKPQRTLIFYHF